MVSSLRESILSSLWIAALLWSSACNDSGSPGQPIADSPEPRGGEPEYVTSGVCKNCHGEAFEAWSDSHHDQAMQRATEETVLGDFHQARFEHFGVVWEFFRDDGRFMVRTEGAGASRAEYEVGYTFGVEPLQQYLVPLADGQMQALTVAWDTRPKKKGGQRWFSLHPNDPTPAGDVLHWMGAANRWNSMCADCHSTNLHKNFDVEQKRYQTTWAEIDVACEACHGPGSRHVAWAEAGADPDYDRGLLGDLPTSDPVRWVMNPKTGIARRDPPQTTHREIESCAPCHSRRSRVHEGMPGGKFLDAYRPALLEDGLYFADGQIRDEVYVYGSFLQSKMYRAGVTCSDCHDPHSLELRASGDVLCGTCHASERFAVASHHHHPQESPGARCVACHMPTRTYMVVDERHDHSFRIPRPELSVDLETPNPCGVCHAERGAEWAAEKTRSWSTARSDRAGPPEISGIARATALVSQSRYPDPATADAIEHAARDANPLVRSAAARAAEALPLGERHTRIGSLLEDPLRSVRIEAARVLAATPDPLLPAHLQRARRSALAEYRHSQTLHSDEPSAHVNLGLLALSRGKTADAEAAYHKAIAVGSYFVPAYVNLADLYRGTGRDTDAESLLRQALRIAPESPEVHHALGLVLVRLGEPAGALEALQRASELAPESSRFGYVYGVALHSFGEMERALATLEKTHRHHPADREVLQALIAMLREGGRPEEADLYAGKLKTLLDGTRQ